VTAAAAALRTADSAPQVGRYAGRPWLNDGIQKKLALLFYHPEKNTSDEAEF
jgi:hypothetical protein